MRVASRCKRAADDSCGGRETGRALADVPDGDIGSCLFFFVCPRGFVSGIAVGGADMYSSKGPPFGGLGGLPGGEAAACTAATRQLSLWLLASSSRSAVTCIVLIRLPSLPTIDPKLGGLSTRTPGSSCPDVVTVASSNPGSFEANCTPRASDIKALAGAVGKCASSKCVRSTVPESGSASSMSMSTGPAVSACAGRTGASACAGRTVVYFPSPPLCVSKP